MFGGKGLHYSLFVLFMTTLTIFIYTVCNKTVLVAAAPEGRRPGMTIVCWTEASMLEASRSRVGRTNRPWARHPPLQVQGASADSCPAFSTFTCRHLGLVLHETRLLVIPLHMRQ